MEEQKKVTWNRYKVFNAINNKYNLYQFEITSLEEASDFCDNYLGPFANIGSNTYDEVDGQICLAIMNNWRDSKELSKEVIPLLHQSTLIELIAKM